MRITYEYGDVTKKYPEYVQAQCISEDCVMGSGVVIAYRRIFPGLKEKCIEYVKWQELQLLLIPRIYIYIKHVMVPSVLIVTLIRGWLCIICLPSQRYGCMLVTVLVRNAIWKIFSSH